MRLGSKHSPETKARLSSVMEGDQNALGSDRSALVGAEIRSKGRVKVKVASGRGHWVHRARVVWEAANGPLPPGHLVHHDNEVKDDDRPENLIAMTRSQHLKLHRSRQEARMKA